MFKVNNKDTRTLEQRHYPRFDIFILNFMYFTRYFSISLVGFEQVSVN